jgi:hypothetical protein
MVYNASRVVPLLGIIHCIQRMPELQAGLAINTLHLNTIRTGVTSLWRGGFPGTESSDYDFHIYDTVLGVSAYQRFDRALYLVMATVCSSEVSVFTYERR